MNILQNNSYFRKLFFTFQQEIKREKELFGMAMLQETGKSNQKLLIQDEAVIDNYYHSLYPHQLELTVCFNFYDQLTNLLKVFEKHCKKFPLVKNNKSIFSNEKIKQKIESDLEFALQEKDSTITHPLVDKGIYLRSKYYQKIKPGTIIGFVPGQFTCLSKKIEKNRVIRSSELQFRINEKLYYPNQLLIPSYKELIKQKILVEGEKINFLAQGHKINHPPLNKKSNVKFFDLNVFDYLSLKQQSYIPCQNISESESKKFKQKVIMLIVSTEEIQDNEELFVDYWDFYNLEPTDQPDWLHIPPPSSNLFLQKRAVDSYPDWIQNKCQKEFENKQKIQQYSLENIEKQFLQEIKTTNSFLLKNK